MTYEDAMRQLQDAFGVPQLKAAAQEEFFVGGLETGANCGLGEGRRGKDFRKGHPCPEGHHYIAFGISDEYEGRASASLSPDK